MTATRRLNKEMKDLLESGVDGFVNIRCKDDNILLWSAKMQPVSTFIYVLQFLLLLGSYFKLL